MNLSGLNDYQLSVFCSVDERDEAKRDELLEQLKRMSIKPVFCGDKIEFRYRGSRDNALKVVAYAEAHLAHSIQISSGVK